MQTRKDPGDPTAEILLVVVLLCLSIWAGYMVHKNLHDPLTYSNRAFAGPALGFSACITAYTFYRLSRVPLWLRLVGTPFLLLAGYLGCGLALLFLDSVF